jgi:hypothetical protein
MRIGLVVLLLLYAIRAEPDDYHSSDPGIIQQKQRLMLPSDIANRTAQPGGIRSRADDQQVDIEQVLRVLDPVKKGHRNLKMGWQQVFPNLQLIQKLNADAAMSLKRMDGKLQKTHERVNKELTGFSRNWQGSILKKAESDPSTFDSTFKKVSQQFITEYKQLKREIDSQTRDTVKAGNLVHRQNVATQALEYKTMNAIERRMRLGAFVVDQLLNRKALPLLIGTKYATAANIANLGKATLDTVDQLTNQVLPDTANAGSVHMEQSAIALKQSADKSFQKAARSIQRSLASMRSDLNRLSMKQSTWVNKNFTAMDASLAAAVNQLDKGRSDSRKKLQSKLNDASDLSNTFKTNVLGTATDLTNMLSAEQSTVASIQQQAKLDSQQMSLGFSGEISALANSVGKNVGTNPADLNTVQSKISAAYASGSSNIASSLSQQARGQAASMLTDASDQSGQLGSMFSDVSSQTQNLQQDLATKAGVANSQLGDLQQTLSRKTSDLSANTMAEIDDSTAETEADRANTLGRFANGVSSMNATLGAQLGSVGDSATSKANALSGQTLSSSQALLSSLVSSGSDMNARLSALAAMKGRLVDIPGKALTQLDAQNEAKLQAAFSQLNGLRQLSGVKGDKFESDAKSAIASIVGKALGPGGSLVVFQGTNFTNITTQTSNLNNASLAYKASVSAFEASMDAELNKASDAFDALSSASSNSAGGNKAIGQIVAHQQSVLADQGRSMVRDIYNMSSSENGIAKFLLANPKLNVDTFLGKRLLNTSSFDFRFGQTLQNLVQDLSGKRAQTSVGIDQFNKYLESLKGQINAKALTDIGDAKRLADLASFRDDAVNEITKLQLEMNATIASNFRKANESVTNKTYNFYKQFQTASIVADSLVQGFADYVDKMISFENATSFQRETSQAALIKSIQEHMANPILNTTGMNSSEIDRINKLVKMAMDTSDQSAEGIKKRKAAAEALVDAVGVDAANRLQAKYQQLAGNAHALSKSIQASADDMKGDRVAGLEGSKMGLDGVSAETQLFANRAGGLLDAQKQNAKAIASKIDELLSGGSFLTNITGQQLAAIMESVQNADGVYRSQLSAYQGSNGDSIATFGGVIESFANLVEQNLNMTTDFLDMMSKNYTALVKQTDALTLTPVNAIKQGLKKTKDVADNVNATLVQNLLSAGPIEDGLQERLDSLNKRNDDFRASINKQLNDMVATIHQKDGEIAASREDGMRKLRSSLSQLLNQFREQALEFQSQRVEQQGSLLELGESDAEIRKDMKNRIRLVRRLIQGDRS